MSSRRRRAVGTAIALTMVAALRLLFPDAAARREWGVLLLLCLGYGHQLGALVAGLRRNVGLRGALGFAGLGAGLLALLALLPLGMLVVALVAVALWHVFENDCALSRCARSRSARLPPLARLPGGLGAVVLALAATPAVLLLPPSLTRWAVVAGVPPAFAVWTTEDLVGLLLLEHVVVWALFAARAGRWRRVIAAHALPLVAGAGAACAWPGALAVLASPLVYLVASVAHALHTALERGVERP